MFIGRAIFPIAVAASCDLIPRIERLLQEEVRFNGLLYLVKREAEFTRRSAAKCNLLWGHNAVPPPMGRVCAFCLAEKYWLFPNWSIGPTRIETGQDRTALRAIFASGLSGEFQVPVKRGFR
jgi:hypothetical protein